MGNNLKICNTFENVEFVEILGCAKQDGVVYMKLEMLNTQKGEKFYAWVEEKAIPDGVPVSKHVALDSTDIFPDILTRFDVHA